MKFKEAIFDLESSNVCFATFYTNKKGKKDIRILRKYSGYLEVFDKDRGYLLENAKICDVGNYKLNEKNVKKVLEKINNKHFIFFCNSHLLTYYVCKILNIKEIIVFDAHLDLKNKYKNKLLNEATWLRRLIELDVKYNVIGARSFDEEEYKIYIKTRAKNLKKYYISIDLDVLEPIYVDVNYPEPNGLSFSELISLIKKYAKKSLSLDIVEFNFSSNYLKNVNYIFKIVYEYLYWKFK